MTQTPQRRKPRGRKRIPDPPPPLDVRATAGSVGLLDPDVIDGWVGALRGKLKERWMGIRATILDSNREFRSATLSLIVLRELEVSRKRFLTAKNITDDLRKSRSISKNSQDYMRAAKSLDEALAKMISAQNDFKNAYRQLSTCEVTMSNARGDGPTPNHWPHSSSKKSET